jgi:hypothetical protein
MTRARQPSLSSGSIRALATIRRLSANDANGGGYSLSIKPGGRRMAHGTFSLNPITTLARLILASQASRAMAWLAAFELNMIFCAVAHGRSMIPKHWVKQ